MNTLFSKKHVSTETIDVKSHAGRYIDSWSMLENRREMNKQEKVILTINDNGIIRDCNHAAVKLLDSSPSELTQQHISKVLPQLAEIKLVQSQQINPYLRFLSRTGHLFEVVSMGEKHFTGELFFRDVENLGQRHIQIIIYPTKQESTIS